MAETVCSKFLEISSRQGERKAVDFFRKGRWIDVSWSAYLELTQATAAGLHTLGIVPGDRVAIIANTRFEWACCDLAILGLGAVTVPIYQSSTSEDVQFILENSGAKILIAESPSILSKLRTGSSLPSHVPIIYMDGFTEQSEREVSLESLQNRGQNFLNQNPDFFRKSSHAVKIDDPATILYTSGTTGQPKGVLLTHTQLMSEVSDAFPLLGVTSRDRSLTFLPFAHILARIEIWGQVVIGYHISYGESLERLKDNLMTVKPTILISVPRVFEKIYAGIMAQAEISPVRKKLFQWAISVGRQISQCKIEKKPVPIEVAVQYQLAKRLVFDKISERLGGQLRFAVCGGAPLSQSIAEFFHAAGLLILEGYGLTETTAAVCVNTPFAYRFGTVGKPIGDVKIKLAEDGEILVHSKKVMKEYYNDPVATKVALVDGWFSTGDIGEFTADGFLRITDRKKDLIKTAGGKYVAPQKLEGLLKDSPHVSQVHIHGDQRKYVVALISLNIESIENFAREQNISYSDREALTRHPKVRELIRQVVAKTNSRLSSYETIKNFEILSRELTIEAGELTPSLKVKRKVVENKFKDLIDKMYGVAE